MYQKSMFDRYYCIKHFFFSLEKEKVLQKVLLPVPIIARKSTLPSNVLEMPLPGQRLTLSLLCTLLMMTSVFILKIAKPCINSTRIALLTHGFVPVKTWLLIECDTAFYARFSCIFLSIIDKYLGLQYCMQNLFFDCFVRSNLNALSTQRVCRTLVSAYGVCVLCLSAEVLCVNSEE